MEPKVPTTQHAMAPLMERVVVPIAFVGIGVLIGMYLARGKKAAQ